MNTIYASRLLKLALCADAIISGAVGLLQLLGDDWLSELLALPKGLVFEAGVFMIGYCVLLIVLARARTMWSGLVGMIVIGNIGWAVGCIGLLAARLVSPNAFGVAFLLVQTVAVLVLAAFEYAGLRNSTPVRGGLSAGTH